MQGNDGARVQLQSRMKKWGGYKQRWIHLVAAYDGHDIRMYVNELPEVICITIH